MNKFLIAFLAFCGTALFLAGCDHDQKGDGTGAPQSNAPANVARTSYTLNGASGGFLFFTDESNFEFSNSIGTQRSTYLVITTTGNTMAFSMMGGILELEFITTGSGNYRITRSGEDPATGTFFAGSTTTH